MKLHKNRTVGATRFILFALLLIGCAPSQDIYLNPYQTNIPRSMEEPVARAAKMEVSAQSQPDWIYAVSRDFYVGYGQGKSVMEAKYAALSDIKAFITKSFGESGKVREVTIVENSITGPGRVSGREDYMLKYDFENEYQPVIHISFNSFEDYYFEFIGYRARYYIKYRINDNELKRIKAEYSEILRQEEIRKNELEVEFQKSHLREKARKINIRRSVDSLTSYQGLLSIEALLERYHAIRAFIYTNDPDDSDSLILANGLKNIEGFLRVMEIVVVEQEHGEYLRFALLSGSSLLLTDFQPIVYMEGAVSESLSEDKGIWEYSYTMNEQSGRPKTIEICFELPFDRIETSVRIEPKIQQPELQIVDDVRISGLDISYWNGKLRSFRAGFNLNSAIDAAILLESFELTLHIEEGMSTVIDFSEINQEILPGTSRVVKNTSCQLPSRYFLKNKMNCDLQISYSHEGTIHSCDFHNVPITINR